MAALLVAAGAVEVLPVSINSPPPLQRTLSLLSSSFCRDRTDQYSNRAAGRKMFVSEKQGGKGYFSKRKTTQAVKTTPHINLEKGATLVLSTVKLFYREKEREINGDQEGCRLGLKLAHSLCFVSAGSSCMETAHPV